MKQWSQASPHEDDPVLCQVDAYAQPVLNPIEQVRRYCEYLVNFNGALAEHPKRVSGVAYLHNATEFGVSGLREIEPDDRGQLFTAEGRGAFLDHLRAKLSDRRPGARAADELLAGKTVPSKQLMALAAQEVREREQFVLLDEQQVAYRIVLNAVRRAKRSDHKETSANRCTSAAHRTGRPQIDELIDVARVPVFLLDEHQVVRPGEMGTVAEIKAAAERKGIDCHLVRLESQFRCGGSDAYLRWVVRLLGLERRFGPDRRVIRPCVRTQISPTRNALPQRGQLAGPVRPFKRMSPGRP